ncbi:MAG: hypothetical protein R3277_02210 [Brumimicrobium sp.]|nr:hypothetical protein [Brumimicrobium sp.]
MKIETVYIINSNEFGNAILEWAEGKQIEAVRVDPKHTDLAELIKGVVIFHENHNFSKEIEEMQEYLEDNNRPAHRIDINGTLAATKSNFTMWLERNKPSKLLILGNSNIVGNPNLKRFLDSLES